MPDGGAGEERPEKPPIPASCRERWGDDVRVCWHPDHLGWAFHSVHYPHQGPHEAEMFDA